MNTNWSKILLFSLLFGIAGFFIGRCCGHGCGERGGCHKQMSCCDKDGQCEHGGDCCKPGGHCDKPGCDHAAMMGGCEHGKKACCMGGHMDMGGDDKVHVIVDGLKARNFQGDTTITIDGGTVNVSRHGDKMEVKVEMKDSAKTEEKTVEVTTH